MPKNWLQINAMQYCQAPQAQFQIIEFDLKMHFIAILYSQGRKSIVRFDIKSVFFAFNLISTKQKVQSFYNLP